MQCTGACWGGCLGSSPAVGAAAAAATATLRRRRADCLPPALPPTTAGMRDYLMVEMFYSYRQASRQLRAVDASRRRLCQQSPAVAAACPSVGDGRRRCAQHAIAIAIAILSKCNRVQLVEHPVGQQRRAGGVKRSLRWRRRRRHFKKPTCERQRMRLQLVRYHSYAD